jgi:hypothetical protein
MGSGLPQVVNGVPPKPTMRQAVPVTPRSAKAGKYKGGGAKPAPRPSGPVTAKTYAPYNGYGGGTPVTSSAPTHGNGTYGQSSVSASTGVRGSLLHWSRTRSGY